MTQTPEEPIDVQRMRMDRAKRLAETDRAPHERPLLPRLVGLGLALLIVVVVLFAFDRFLASMQRFLSLPITDPEPALTEPLPAYSVPADEGTFEDGAQPADGRGAAEDAAPAVTPAETAPKP
jgi:hypothetical protein